MTVTYTRTVRWECDECGKVERGWEDERPEGWTSRVYDHGTRIVLRDYCSPACVPPEKPE